MHRTPWFPLALGIMVAVGSCGTSEDRVSAPTERCVEDFQDGADYFPDKVDVEYAQGWSVEYRDYYKVLRTSVEAAGGHGNTGSRFLEGTYVLLQCGAPEPPLTGELADATVIEIPTERVVDGGSVLYAAIERLGTAESLVGEAERFVGEVEAPYLPEVSERVASGEVAEIGYEVNLEALAEADPDFYTNYAGDDAMFSQVEELGIPVVYYFPYAESPLGASEQVKFLSLFHNLEAEANDIFAPIEERYQDLRSQVQAEVEVQQDVPSVLVGSVDEAGEVRTRQAQRFEPQLIREAGGRTVPELEGAGIATQSLESFLDEGADTDHWLDMTFFPKHESKSDYLAADPRLEPLNPLHDGTTFNRMGRGGDWFLNGAVDADVVLADLVSILHPSLLPDHELQYLDPVDD